MVIMEIIMDGNNDDNDDNTSRYRGKMWTIEWYDILLQI
jgi:hypothetical protein